MCGITGWIDWEKNLEKEASTIEDMAASLKHRGPDDLTTWVTRNAVFGHTRLIVIDPAGGKQPMTRMYGGRAFTIVYNGELYNTEDLRQELIREGYRFRGHSDTEVLLTAFIEYGHDLLDKLNGIFAFAIWNEKKQELFMARDRLGVKPLFYSLKNKRLLFGSEQKAILAHPDIRAVVDREGLAEIFGLGPSRTPGHGVYKDMDELRPAHALVFNREHCKIWRYWDVKSDDHRDTEDETITNVRELFHDAVSRQLVADVPLGTFLSGGLDSSAITSITAQEFEKDRRGTLHTYSIDYEDNEKYFEKSKFTPNADAPFVKRVSDFLKTKHNRHIIDNRILADYLRTAVHARDLPGYADVDSSMLWFCERIREDAIVALSGECADEILGGYPWFHSPETSAAQGFPWMRSTEARQSLLTEEWQTNLNLKDYVNTRFEDTVKEVPELEGENEVDAKRRQLFYLNMHWFMATLLDRKDRMSMATSLEVRVPFADHRFVEYLWNVPWDMKMLDGREKGLFRRAMKGTLPESVLYRKKSPYPKTFHPVYTEAVTNWFSEILSDRSSPILEFMDREKLKRIVETGGESFRDPWYGQLMKGPQLIAHLAQINTWLNDYKIEIDDR